jgi:hypothetical protein
MSDMGETTEITTGEITVEELLLRCLRAEGINAMFGIVEGAL